MLINSLRHNAAEDHPDAGYAAHVSASRSLRDGVQRRTLPTPRGEFAALEAGDGPVVLLVPGWTGSKEDFIAVLPLLAAAGYRAVAIDQRGQFETPGSGVEASYTLQALAADLLSVVHRLAAPGTQVHLVGHSFGGLVARTAVIADPEAVATLALLCSGPEAVPRDRRKLLMIMAQLIPTKGLAATWQAKRSYERSRGAPEPPAGVEDFLRHRFVSNDPVSLRAMTNHLITAPDQVEDLRSTGVPVLVAYGAADDGWPPAIQRAMAAELGARLRVIDGAGHSPAAERPAETVAVLTDFWAASRSPGRQHLPRS